MQLFKHSTVEYIQNSFSEIKIVTMSDSEDIFGDNSRITADSRSLSTDSLRDGVTVIEESQSLLLPPHSSAGNHFRETDQNQDNNNEVPTQLEDSHLLLGMVQGIKRSMETMGREMKRIKEQNVALDKKVSSVLKKHDTIEKQLKSLDSKCSKVKRQNLGSMALLCL